MTGGDRQTEPLERIDAALERISPPPAATPVFAAAEAYVWHTEPDRLAPVPRVSRRPLDLLVGIERARDHLQQMIETGDADTLKQAIKQVEAVSENYVERRMNASVQKVLAGKNIDQVEV